MGDGAPPDPELGQLGPVDPPPLRIGDVREGALTACRLDMQDATNPRGSFGSAAIGISGLEDAPNLRAEVGFVAERMLR